MEIQIERKLSYTRLAVRVVSIGKDYHILLQGGECPHIGCTVLTVPRPSLEEAKQKMSSTASVLNVIGHKDEQLCRYLAEQIAAKTGAVTVCTGGFHVEHITGQQIEEVLRSVREIAEEITEEITGEIIR